MNLISKLLSLRHPPQSAGPPHVTWIGQSGAAYEYTIYSLETEFRPLPGNYIYAGKAETGEWVPIYIAQTRDMHQRLEGHERLQPAMANGATHIHMHYCEKGQASRCTEERDLITHWQPVCNETLES